jgi:hypothetical protein
MREASQRASRGTTLAGTGKVIRSLIGTSPSLTEPVSITRFGPSPDPVHPRGSAPDKCAPCRMPVKSFGGSCGPYGECWRPECR